MLVHVWGACGPGLTGPGLRAAPGDPGLSQKVAPAPGVLVGSATGGKGAFPRELLTLSCTRAMVPMRGLLTKRAFQIASASCGPRALSRLPWARSLASWRR